MRDALTDRTRLRSWSDLVNAEVGALDTVKDLISVCAKRNALLSSVRLSKIRQDTLCLNHLATLQPGRWVHSSLLSAWHSLIANNALHVCFASQLLPIHTVWILDTGSYDQLAGVSRDDTGLILNHKGFSKTHATRLVRGKNMKNVSRVVIPINLSNSHWISVGFDCESGTWTIYDSLGGQHSAVEQHLRFLTEVAFGKQEPRVEYTEMKSQLDNDCGVFTMLVSLKLASGWGGLPVASHGKQYRETISRCLLTGLLVLNRSEERRSTAQSSGAPSVTSEKLEHSGPTALDSPLFPSSHWQRKPQTTESKQARSELALANDQELMDRFLGIMLHRVEAGEDPDAVVDEALATGQVEHWCTRYEGKLWLPLVTPAPHTDRGMVPGQGMTIASCQTGPKGGQFAVDTLSLFLKTVKPGVLHTQELRTQRHKVALLKKRITDMNTDYTVYTSVAAEWDKVAGSHLGVATMLRTDLMESVQKIDLPEAVAGRVLALLVEGVGADKKTLHVNVYQHVNTAATFAGMKVILDCVYNLAKWTMANGYNMILCGDLNATLSDDLRVNYSDADKLGAGDQLLLDCFSATGATCAGSH
eukprot:1301071-Rhodomonas_salina.3